MKDTVITNTYSHILTVDLEATCSDDESIRRTEMETIEIGAVMVKTDNLTVVDEFQTFIQPVRHPILTTFCQTLTTISQAEVNQAPKYPEAIEKLKSWLSKYPDAIFGSWGDYDFKQLKQDSDFHRVPFPIAYSHVNLKQRFSDVQQLPKRYGMAQALKMANIPLEGTHHRGIDDARNIAKLLPYIMGLEQLIKAVEICR